jgi:hypothetical protein
MKNRPSARPFGKALALTLAFVLLAGLTGCWDDAPASNSGSSPSSANSPVQTQAEARSLLQSWLDANPFAQPVTINDSLTTENDTGFTFLLYQADEELATIRVIKATGALLRRHPEEDHAVSIDAWYKNLSADMKAPPPTDNPGDIPEDTQPGTDLNDDDDDWDYDDGWGDAEDDWWDYDDGWSEADGPYEQDLTWGSTFEIIGFEITIGDSWVTGRDYSGQIVGIPIRVKNLRDSANELHG